MRWVNICRKKNKKHIEPYFLTGDKGKYKHA